MRRLLMTATAVGLAFGGSAFAQSTTSDADQGASDMWTPMEVACIDFVAASDADQRDIVASIEDSKRGEADESAATGSAAETESNKAINSGADVSAGTRGTDQSGTAALTAEGAEAGDPAGTTYESVSVSDVVEACEGSPDTRVSEIVDQKMTQ